MFCREVRAPTYRIDGTLRLSICISDELKKWPSHQIISSAASCVTLSKQDSCCRQSMVDDGSHFHSPINWTIKTQMPAMDSTAVCPMKARPPISCQICCVEIHCVFLLNVFRTRGTHHRSHRAQWLKLQRDSWNCFFLRGDSRAIEKKVIIGMFMWLSGKFAWASMVALKLLRCFPEWARSSTLTSLTMGQ